MKQLYIEEIKKRQIKVLKDVHEFCKINSINYILIYGTLLGAIRHKGYIPWDDDIDIAMPMPDYIRFIELYNKKESKYRARALEMEKRFPFAFAKVEDTTTRVIENVNIKTDIGINIDIFPIYGLSDNKKTREKELRNIRILNYIFLTKTIKINSNRAIYKNIILLGLKAFTFLIPYHLIFHTIKKIMMKHKYEESKEVKIADMIFKKVIPFPKYFFKERNIVEFEKEEFFIPKNYHNVLKDIYGDYMQLPPIEEQKSHHSYEAYIKD